MNKQAKRLRRARATRAKIRRLETNRLTVYRTPRHMYAQITTAGGEKTLISASTLDKELRATLKLTGNIEAAFAVGKLIAQRAVAVGLTKVAFDRAGFMYHGRVKALADAAREGGLQF